MKRPALVLLAVALLASAAVAADDGYVVQKGDTLWDITGRSLDDPFLWPRVWSDNRRIENPHLLTPGQLLAIPSLAGTTLPAQPAPRIESPAAGGASAAATPAEGPAAVAATAGSGVAHGITAAAPPPRPEVAEEPSPAFPPASVPPGGGPPPARSSGDRTAGRPAPAALPEKKAGGRFLPQAEKQDLVWVLATYGFIAERAEMGLGKVSAVESGHTLLNLGDQAMIDLVPGAAVTAGRTYSIAKTVREVLHPLSGEAVGMLVRILGEVTVTAAGDGGTGGEVTALYGPAEVGDSLMERVDYLSWIPREGTPAPATLTGTVLDSPDGLQNLGNGAVLFIDLGTRDGVGPGTRLAVWDERPEGKDAPRSIEELPAPASMGEIVVIAPREKTSVARLTASRREIIPGAVVGGVGGD
jgi:hypothetical protein